MGHINLDHKMMPDEDGRVKLIVTQPSGKSSSFHFNSLVYGLRQFYKYRTDDDAIVHLYVLDAKLWCYITRKNASE